MTRKVARAAPAGKRWGGSGGQGREQEVSGRWRKGCRDQFLEHSGLRHLRPAEIWVCAGDDGWSDGLQDLMA